MKKIVILISLVLTMLSCYQEKKYVKAKINKKIYKFELAVTDQERAKGLMFRKKLDKDSGMLFVYSSMNYLYFYMKNTIIPLDIAFLDYNYKIVDIQSMEPLDETTIMSKKKAMYALEVNRGFFDRVGLKIGDKIEFITPIPYLLE
ncbi:MAG TPA: DUF192 domain-containing protein [Spirochaetota bacterium]|nr:DUF192 domain-containing protein [Spirochaetota bacterium]HOL57735.1 DUF192 domain-containing protein [Spirochaetota bacterium]HPP05301.1 DUF192 domain-containing protein [Spirochaetota bacterium]